VIHSLLNWITWIENSMLVVLLATMVLLAGSQIVFRNLLDLSVLGVDQTLRQLVLWVAMLGAVAASRDRKHITIDIFSRFLAGPRLHLMRVATDFFTAAICALLAWHAARFVLAEGSTTDKAFVILPIYVAQLILPISFSLIALRYTMHAIDDLRALFDKPVSHP